MSESMNGVIMEGRASSNKEYKIVDGPVTLGILREICNNLLKDVPDDAVLHTGFKSKYGFGSELLTASCDLPITVEVSTGEGDTRVSFFKHQPELNPFAFDDDDDDEDDDEEDYDKDDVSSDYDPHVDCDYGVRGRWYKSGHSIYTIMDTVEDELEFEDPEFQLDVINRVIEELMKLKEEQEQAQTAPVPNAMSETEEEHAMMAEMSESM